MKETTRLEKNGTQWTEITVNDSFLITKWGKLNSDKLQESSKEFKGNSKHTPNEQAEIAYKQKITLKHRSEWRKPGEVLIKEYELVTKLTSLKGQWNKLEKHLPVVGLPKLNGLNGRYDNGRLLSRGNKDFKHLTSLLDIFKKAEERGINVNGLCFELFCPGKTLEEINEAAADEEQGELLNAYVFDRYGGDGFASRYVDAHKTVNQIDSHRVKMVDVGGIFHTVGEPRQYYKSLMEKEDQDIEGVVFHSANAPYRHGKRSVSDWKQKPLISHEFQIFDCVCDRTGKGLAVLSFILLADAVDKKGASVHKQFKVVPKATHAERNKLWKFFEEGSFNPVDEWMKLDFQEWTKYRLPKNIEACSIRNEDQEGSANES